ncbi:MAG: Lrp/AsnC family transcriptional regulator [Proteobacteria bacterium]|jgi:DNA-binding Lrp family transcriptional regulator|nr:Lrp/AsnC family transcriptional regulator [Pseudomonadota bacterium]
MNEIAELLQKDARLTPEDIASMLNKTVAEVRDKIRQMEDDGTIIKYCAVINEEKLQKQKDKVVAFIEIQVQPEREKGFDALAERIYQFPQVTSLYLMSGRYDLLAVVEGDNLKDVAFFVSDKLSTLDNVKGTTTHFLLKKYKENGTMLFKQNKLERLNVAL